MALHFDSLDDLARHVDALDAADERRARARWTPAQNLEHVTRTIDASIDGFGGARMALPFRILGRLMRGGAMTRTFKSGYAMPPAVRDLFAPADDVTWPQAVEHFRRTKARLDDGARMTHASPFFGELDHDEWARIHCRHAELHLGNVETA